MTVTVNLEIFDPQDVAAEVSSIREAISQRAYTMFEQRGRVDGDDLADWFGAEAELLQPTSIQLKQLKDRIEVRADLGGFPASEVKISTEPWQLVLTGTRQRQALLRMIDLPAEIDPARASASAGNGIVAIRLPKAAGA